MAKKNDQNLSGDSATTTRTKYSESPDMEGAREKAIARGKKLRSQIIGIGRPISVQMEESFRNIFKMTWDEKLSKYPELQAKVDAQKALEKQANRKLKAELARLMKENNLTEEDVTERTA